MTPQAVLISCYAHWVFIDDTSRSSRQKRSFSAITHSHLFAFSLVRLTASLFLSIATHVVWGRKELIKALTSQ